MGTVVGVEDFFCHRILVTYRYFLLKSRTIMNLIILEITRLGQYFEYPCYGGLAHRNFLEGFESQRKCEKVDFFAIFCNLF